MLWHTLPHQTRLQAIRQSGQDVPARAMRNTTVFWLVIFLATASVGSAPLCLRFWQGVMLCTVFVCIGQERTSECWLAFRMYPFIRKTRHLAWFTGMQ